MIRVAIVDDHAIVRAGLKQFLEEDAEVQVTGEAANGADAMALVRSGQLDALIMDLSMPGQNGVDLLAAIQARSPQLPVLVLSGFPEEHYATTLLKQGAKAYLNKECDPDEILRAVKVIAKGRKYISATVAELLANQLGKDDQKKAHELLSEREFQVFLHLARGETVGNIAELMFLSVKTISTYRSRILEKLALETNSDLTYYALKNGLIT